MVAQPFMASTSIGAALSTALLKLIDVIDEENAVLRLHKIGIHSVFTDRKNQALRELMAAQRSTLAPAAQEACGPLLKSLSAALRENARLLKLNIAAVGEISDIIIGSLREAESDGTYSRGRATARW